MKSFVERSFQLTLQIILLEDWSVLSEIDLDWCWKYFICFFRNDAPLISKFCRCAIRFTFPIASLLCNTTRDQSVAVKSVAETMSLRSSIIQLNPPNLYR